MDKGSVAVPLFVTLTYPSSYPHAASTVAGHLRALRGRLERRYGKFSCIWRKEYQRRGAPHYHLLVFLETPIPELRAWISQAWFEVVGSGDERHLRAGTQVVEVRSWRGIRGYASKYMAKVDDGEAEVQLTGRLWGVWRRELLPIFPESINITLSSFFRMRRAFRRLSRQKSTHRLVRSSCFLDYATAVRLL